MAEQLGRSKRKRTAPIRYSGGVSLLEETPDLEHGNYTTTRKICVAEEQPAEIDFAANRSLSSDVSFRSAAEDGASSEDYSMDNDDVDAKTSTQHKAAQTYSRSKRQSTNKVSGSYRTRGLVALPKLSKIWDVAKVLVGSDINDQTRVVRQLELWFDNAVLPMRILMLQASQEAEDARAQLWTWYDDGGGKELFAQMQVVRKLDTEEAQQYFPPRHTVHKTVLGPYWEQRMFHLKLDEPLHLARTWKPAQTPPGTETQDIEPTLERNGWILNLGAKIQSISWAPIPHHATQFLAVALDHPEPEQAPKHTAFEPSSVFRSCIQIWSFEALADQESSYTLNSHRHPWLAHVVCTEWGMCKELKWCPYPRTDTETGQTLHLGLLATIWSDGFIRVLDIRIPSNPTNGSLHVRYEKAAFASRPPNTIFTVVSWSSPTGIVAGCADGNIAAWNLEKSLDKRPSAKQTGKAAKRKSKKRSESIIPEEPLPQLYHQLHNSYILAAEHCVPDYPWFLMTLSIDGTYRLCDLRNPIFDTTESRRYRVYPSAFDYCPQLVGALTSDGYEGVNLQQIRHFLPEVSVTNSNARVSAVACGRAHPHGLVGSVDGTVVAFNITPCLFRDKKPNKRWETVWFKHEWRPETGLGSMERDADRNEHENQASEHMDHDRNHFHHKGLREGVSRITEAYEPYILGSKRGIGPMKRTARDRSSARQWETIFEEPSAITQLKWNPNPRFGGWAAAGMGSGLLRVEDLAI